MKKFLALFLILAITAVLAVSCTGKVPPSETTTTTKEPETTTTSGQENPDTDVYKLSDRIGSVDFDYKVAYNKENTPVGAVLFIWNKDVSDVVVPESLSYVDDGGNKYELPVYQLGVSGGIMGKYQNKIKTFEIPSSVKAIAKNAFSMSPALESVVAKEGLETIGDSAFWCCTSLKSIVLPSTLKSIGTIAFSGCSSLTSVVIPESVTEIGESAFIGCSSLASVTLPSSFKDRASEIFNGCAENLVITYVG